MAEEAKKKSKGAPGRAGKRRANRADYKNLRQSPNKGRSALKLVKDAILHWRWAVRAGKSAGQKLNGAILNAKRMTSKDNRAEITLHKGLAALDLKHNTALVEQFRNMAL